MADSRIEAALNHQEQMETDRSTLEAHWKEVAERVLPRQDNFQKQRIVEGEKRTEHIFDSTAPLALDRAASAVDSLVTPSTQTYHRMEPEDSKLLEDREVKLWCEELNKAHFRMRYRAIANFASQAHECFVSLMAFGNLAMYIEDVLGVGTRYKSCSLAEVYFAENHAGIVDLVHRKFPMAARQALQKFGADNLPKGIVQAADQTPFRKFDFLHCVKPNEGRKRGSRDYTGMPFSSYYISYEGRQMVGEGGFWSMPYAISRHVTAPRETYGRGPAMMVLPDIKMINEMEKTVIRAAHKIVDPPLLLYGDGILSNFATRPGALNYGGVDEQGRQLAHPMKMGSNLPIAFEMQADKRKTINDAFYVTLFQILVQNPQMTATEALIRAQEKGQLLAPTVGRQQSEFLGAVTTRERDILMRSYSLPPMPDALRRSGGQLKVVYTSPLTRLRRAEDGVAMSRWLEGLVPLAENDPSVLDNVDVDFVARESHDIHGAPVGALRAIEVVKQMREDRAKQQEEQRQAMMAQEMAKTAQHASKANLNMTQGAEGQPVQQPA